MCSSLGGARGRNPLMELAPMVSLTTGWEDSNRVRWGDRRQTNSVASKTQLVSPVAGPSQWLGGAKLVRLATSQ
jgi:hypothetical protein